MFLTAGQVFLSFCFLFLKEVFLSFPRKRKSLRLFLGQSHLSSVNEQDELQRFATRLTWPPRTVCWLQGIYCTSDVCFVVLLHAFLLLCCWWWFPVPFIASIQSSLSQFLFFVFEKEVFQYFSVSRPIAPHQCE
jgi:hypothetical protein